MEQRDTADGAETFSGGETRQTTLFAVTVTNGCSPDYGGTAGLWRSDARAVAAPPALRAGSGVS